MGTITVSEQERISAAADTVYRYIADYQEHHPHFLPPAFSDFEVVSGGVGAGTVTTFKVTAGGRTREYRMTIAEPEPGHVLTETDSGSSLVTTWTVTPQGDNASTVDISTSWQGAGGIGGFFERRFAPRALRTLYGDELDRLDAYASERRATP
jgi:ribosome-associated toxin RatA of RatAB toxin-antitoxin module